MGKPIISIVICTHRRFSLLDGAVKSLVEQNVTPDCYEVLVVDNDHKPNLKVQDIVKKVELEITIKYIHESKLGLSHARNTGGKISGTDYIGYMDDDAKAPVNYIENIVKFIQQQHPDIFGGPHFPFYLDSKPEWFRDSYGAGTKGPTARLLTTNEYLAGMNIIFHRSILEQAGWFDPELGMTGNKVWYGEETMVIIRAREVKKDLKVYYAPDIFVQHLVPAQKMSVLNQFKVRFQTGRSQVYFWISVERLTSARIKAPVNLIRILFVILLKTVPQLLTRDRSQYPFMQNYLFEEVSKSFSALGGQVQLIADLFKHNSPKGC